MNRYADCSIGVRKRHTVRPGRKSTAGLLRPEVTNSGWCRKDLPVFFRNDSLDTQRERKWRVKTSERDRKRLLQERPESNGIVAKNGKDEAVKRTCFWIVNALKNSMLKVSCIQVTYHWIVLLDSNYWLYPLNYCSNGVAIYHTMPPLPSIKKILKSRFRKLDLRRKKLRLFIRRINSLLFFITYRLYFRLQCGKASRMTKFSTGKLKRIIVSIVLILGSDDILNTRSRALLNYLLAYVFVDDWRLFSGSFYCGVQKECSESFENNKRQLQALVWRKIKIKKNY